VEVMRNFEQAFGCAILEGYGLSETSPVASFNHPDRERKPGSIGTPIEGVEMKLVGKDGGEVAPGEVGEIAIRGHNVMKGYWRRPDATADTIRGGWFHSGDLAVWHPDGYVEIKDRSKDIIISGGENVSSLEVEEVLYRHPAVMEAAVVAKPDARWGETPCAFVTLRPDVAPVTGEEIIAWCRAHLAHFKAPGAVILGPLPKTSTGKIQKFVLREQAKAVE
jgi:long-chain acyl-CoA synthetase